jgi:hypothetical protein
MLAQSTATPQNGAPGAMKATTTILADGSQVVRVVNPDKREATETTTDSAGKVIKKVWYSLDERDLTTGAVHYDAKGNIRYKESYKRDAADRIIVTYLYSANDKYLGKRETIYDTGTKHAAIVDYDAQGNMISNSGSSSSGNTTSKGRPPRRR